MGSFSSCPSCGRSVTPEHIFCGGCGTQLRDASLARTRVRSRDEDPVADRCGSCNEPVDASVSFCTGCGAPRRATDSGAMLAPMDELRERLETATEGEYRILAPLGRGGMGSVFLALDLSLHRHVAIKVMAPALVQDVTMQERFRTEARIVATLRHPGIVSIHGLRIVDDLFFFTMDYVEGATLRSVIRTHGRLSIDVTRAVLYDVGGALQHAHSRAGGVIHRDVKPSNVILEPHGHAIVMDFGISKAANTRSGLTMTGVVVGTPEYMSPEQCRGGEITAGSDQYSLGLMGYTMLTGAPPFTGQHWNVLAQQTTEDPTPIRQLRPDCPDDVAEAIERMLAKSVRDRWPDVLTAVKAVGGRPQEDGSPVRVEIGKLAEGASEASSAKTPVVRVTVDGLPERTRTGEVVSISVTPLDGVGRALSDRVYTLESTDPSVLEVVGVDKLRAVQPGSATIVARCESAEASWPLLVLPPPVHAVEIEPVEPPVRTGDRRSLRAVVRDQDGRESEGRSVVWASSAPEVARVSESGELTAGRPGTTTIFATSDGQSTTLELVILPDAMAAAAASPEAEPPPEATRLSGRARAPVDVSRGAEDRRPISPVIWITGVAAFLIAGILWLIPLLDGSREVADESAPPVAAAVTSLDVTQGGQPLSELELRVGDEVDLVAQPLDDKGLPLDNDVTWSSSDRSVATVDEGGRLVALASGSAIISVLSDGVRQTLGTSVREAIPDPATSPPERETTSVQTSELPARTRTPPPTAAELSVRRGDDESFIAAGVRMDAGSALPLHAEARSAEGARVPGASVTWSSSTPGVALVDSEGVLRAISEGVARIRGRTQDIVREFSVTVVAPEPGRLVLTVRPWAYVSIDGVRQGEDQRRLELFLAPGTHSVRLENPTMTTFDTTVVIRSNERTTVDKLLTSGG